MSLAKEIVDESIRSLVTALGLEEIVREDGVYKRLTSTAMPDFSGSVRLFRGRGHVERMVSTSLVIPARHAQTHMVFCFGAADTTIPHFTVDAADHGASLAFHLDLIPRLELCAHLPHMREVYGPLTESFERANALEGVSPVKITPEQQSVMSPWMLVKHATPDAFRTIKDSIVPVYRERFVALTKQAPATSPQPARDRAARAALFDPSVDPVWGRVERMVGAESSTMIRKLLTGELEVA